MDTSSINNVVWLAIINVFSLVVLAIIQMWSSARKEEHLASATLEATTLAAKIKSEEKAEDWRRQDEVAERVAAAAREAKVVAQEVAIVARQAADAADLLLKAQAETVARTDEVARLASESDKRLSDKMDAIDEQGKKIHILVNSDMTAARTQERDSLKLLLIALRRVQGLNNRLGSIGKGSRAEDQSAEDHDIADAEKRIDELNDIIAVRQAAQLRVEEEAMKLASEGKPPVDGDTP